MWRAKKVDGGFLWYGACYSNAEHGSDRVVFTIQRYFLLPKEMMEDGEYFLYVTDGPHPCAAGLELAGQFKTCEELVMAMVLMCGSGRLKYEYGTIFVWRENLRTVNKRLGTNVEIVY